MAPVDPNTGQPMGLDPAMAAQMQGQPPPDGQQIPPEMMAGEAVAPGAEGQTGDLPPQNGADGAQNEDFSMLVDAVRQVLQEMGITPGQTAQPKQKSKGGGKVDAEDVARLQSAVGYILQEMGLVDQKAILEEAIQPAPPEMEEAPADPAQAQQAAAEGVPEEHAAAGAAGMGAHPGHPADLPAQATSLAGPLDPNAGEAMAAAGQAGRMTTRRSRKMASIIFGRDTQDGQNS